MLNLISGAIFTDLLQQNLINSSFCAPIATFMEIAVIKWLRELVGYNIKPIKNIYDVEELLHMEVLEVMQQPCFWQEKTTEEIQ